MKISGKTALVTGANRGIGFAIVNALLDNGVKKVYATARDISSMPDFEDPRVELLRLDINDTEQIDQAVKSASDIDLLINNAGVAAFTSLLDGPREALSRDMQTNYFGTLDMIRSFVPTMENRNGSAIVNVASIAAFVNFPLIGGYSASKAALFSLSQGIRIELANRGIAVHTVNPGPIDTELAKDFPADKASPQETAKRIIQGIENDQADIFPDDGGRQMFDVWNNDYRDLEAMVNQMHHAA